VVVNETIPAACPNCPPGYDCERGIYATIPAAPMTPEGMIPGADGLPICPTCREEDCTGCPHPLADAWAEYEALGLDDIHIRPSWVRERRSI
jgi:hypothetical protein